MLGFSQALSLLHATLDVLWMQLLPIDFELCLELCLELRKISNTSRGPYIGFAATASYLRVVFGFYKCLWDLFFIQDRTKRYICIPRLHHLAWIICINENDPSITIRLLENHSLLFQNIENNT